VVKLIEYFCFGDAHCAIEKSEVKDGRFYPAYVAGLTEREKEDYLNFFDQLTQKAFKKLLERVQRLNFDIAIDFGDNIAGGANQEGIKNEKAKRELQEYNRLIANALPEIPILSLWSGHVTGYNDPITEIQGQKSGRMSIESFNAAEKLIGKPWFSERTEGFTLIFLNSEIIRESKNSKNLEQDFFVQKQKEQEKFIQERLENTKNKVILFIHDPMQLRHIQKILEPHKENIVLILAGHMHSPTIWKIYCLLSKIVKTFKIRIPKILQKTPKQQAVQSLIQEMADMQEIIQAFDIKIIPAIWGQVGLPQRIILGRGGYAILTLNDGQFSLDYHKL
jgi:predicted MPP superfamily phosphohydrolase